MKIAMIINPNDNKAALVQIMTWCFEGDKPLFETMMTKFTDAYMRHSTLVRQQTLDTIMW